MYVDQGSASSSDHNQGAGWLSVRTLSAFWGALIRLRAYGLVCRLRCAGSRPADCWIPPGQDPDAEPGYYRGGILRQYCQRFRGHRNLCLAPITERGHEMASPFVPED